jgi:hypothetical protein
MDDTLIWLSGGQWFFFDATGKLLKIVEQGAGGIRGQNEPRNQNPMWFGRRPAIKADSGEIDTNISENVPDASHIGNENLSFVQRVFKWWSGSGRSHGRPLSSL